MQFSVTIDDNFIETALKEAIERIIQHYIDKELSIKISGQAKSMVDSYCKDFIESIIKGALDTDLVKQRNQMLNMIGATVDRRLMELAKRRAQTAVEQLKLENI